MPTDNRWDPAGADTITMPESGDDWAREDGQDEVSAGRLLFLADAGRILSSSLDYESTLQTIARLAVPAVADLCIIDLVERDGAIRRAATAHRYAHFESTLAELRNFPPVTNATRGVPAVLRTGRPEFVPHVDDALLKEATAGPEHLRIVQQLGVRSLVIVPLISHTRVAGALTLAYTDSERVYRWTDVSLASELASHAALAIENALLYREVRLQLKEREHARDALQREHNFLRLLLEITTAANEAPSLEHALQLTLERVRAHTGWPIGHAYVLGDAGELVSSRLWSTDVPERFRPLREVTESVQFVPGIGLPGRVLATGRAVAAVDLASDPSFLRGQLAPLDVQSAFAFPVRTGLEIVAVLEFFSGRAIEPGGEFLEVMEHVGTQLGRVVDRQRAVDASQQEHKRAEDAVRLRDDVLRMLSHDLRNPLNTIRLATCALREEWLNEQQRGEQLKFTPGGGQVTLKAEPQPEEVVFSVTDTGPGITADEVTSLFDPFWQAQRTAHLGSGLGLPISKAIVEAHGGRIWVDSELGHGTAVHFTLARARSA